MATNPYEEASSSRARGGGRIWLVALAVAALVTTIAWAAPLGGQRPTAELSYGTHHIAPSDGRATLAEMVTFDEPQSDSGLRPCRVVAADGAWPGSCGRLLQGARGRDGSGARSPSSKRA